LKADNHSHRRSGAARVEGHHKLGAPDRVRPRAKGCRISDRSADLFFVKEVLDGDENAARALRARYDAQLMATLCKRGASRTEAEDLLADLWADCFGSSGKPILQKYQGRCPLSAWLNTVATNRLIDFKRREAFRRELLRDESGNNQTNDFEGIGDFPARQPDSALVGLLRRPVVNAFAAESLEMLLMIRLVHIYEVTQREIGRIWNWHESKVSRALESARVRIRTAVLAELCRADPWLTLEWGDFLELARCAPDIVSRGGSEN
jgi:RNA polymerase sigma factor (sigma-70 family)